MALLSEVLTDTAAAMGVELPPVEVILMFLDLIGWDRREPRGLDLQDDPALQYKSDARYVAVHAILGEIRYFAAPRHAHDMPPGLTRPTGDSEEDGPREWGVLATPADAVHLIVRYLAGNPLESIAAERRPPPFRTSVRTDAWGEDEDPGTMRVFRPGEPVLEFKVAKKPQGGTGKTEG